MMGNAQSLLITIWKIVIGGDNMIPFIVEMDNIGYKVGHKYLVKNINWNISRGDHWVVFGMNGSGKTTLLSIMAGFLKQTEGKLKLFGRISDEKNNMELRSKIGWVSASCFDKYYTRESVIDIVLSGKYGSLGREDDISLEDRRRARNLLNELDLKKQADYSFDMLSKGERQNVLIGRALFSNPEILVLDEPCTGLDIYNREYLYKMLEKLAARNGMTLVYVTHYLEEIRPLFNKTLLLKHGGVFAKGSTEELFSSPTMSEFLECSSVVIKDDVGFRIELPDVEPHILHLLPKGGRGNDDRFEFIT